MNAGVLVSFDGSGSTDNIGISNYTWSFTYNSSLTHIYGVSPTFKFWVVGNYTVTLNVTDAAGNWDTDTMLVRVGASSGDITLPVANAGADQNVFIGNIVTLDATASTDNVGVINYTWRFTYNNTARTLYGVSPQFTFWTMGNYTMTLTVSDVAGNTGIDTLIVRVSAPPSSNDSINWWNILGMLSTILGIIGGAISVYKFVIPWWKKRKQQENPPSTPEIQAQSSPSRSLQPSQPISSGTHTQSQQVAQESVFPAAVSTPPPQPTKTIEQLVKDGTKEEWSEYISKSIMNEQPINLPYIEREKAIRFPDYGYRHFLELIVESEIFLHMITEMKDYGHYKDVRLIQYIKGDDAFKRGLAMLVKLLCNNTHTIACKETETEWRYFEEVLGCFVNPVITASGKRWVIGGKTRKVTVEEAFDRKAKKIVYQIV